MPGVHKGQTRTPHLLPRPKPTLSSLVLIKVHNAPSLLLAALILDLLLLLACFPHSPQLSSRSVDSISGRAGLPSPTPFVNCSPCPSPQPLLDSDLRSCFLPPGLCNPTSPPVALCSRHAPSSEGSQRRQKALSLPGLGQTSPAQYGLPSPPASTQPPPALFPQILSFRLCPPQVCSGPGSHPAHTRPWASQSLFPCLYNGPTITHFVEC